MMNYLRQLVWKVIGYPDHLQSLLDYLAEHECVIYLLEPTGVKLQLTDHGEEYRFEFATLQERQCFVQGLNIASKMLDGHLQTSFGDSEDEALAKSVSPSKKVH